MEENKTKVSLKIFILFIMVIILAVLVALHFINQSSIVIDENEISTQNEEIIDNEPVEDFSKSDKNFNLSFLKLENEKKNKIYSPLSIKYALSMVSSGCTNGNTRQQIINLIGDSINFKNYTQSEHLSIANGFFVRDTYKDSIEGNYINLLKSKYTADVVFDSFETPDKINSWVSDKTLNLINNLVDEIQDNENFFLVNALGIDMDWKNKFLPISNDVGTEYCDYEHETYWWNSGENVQSASFDETQKVSGMEIVASINRYDIVNEIGEESIKDTVGKEFRKWAREDEYSKYYFNVEDSSEITDEMIETELASYLPPYLKEINNNYKRIDYTTDFSYYVDDNVKVFAKDLKEYDGTTLEYIGIMPTSQDLDNYIENLNEDDIDNLIFNLKELTLEDSKDGVVTEIRGFIPKFKFEYDLKLKEDLQKLGVTDIFEQGKANLTGISKDKDVYIDKAIHKANIEFTQDGIKAAAATMFGGLGAGGDFDYLYEVPVELIDLTFDKPYMFIIRDKETNENWFTGTVYEPLSWDDEVEKEEGRELKYYGSQFDNDF